MAFIPEILSQLNEGKTATPTPNSNISSNPQKTRNNFYGKNANGDECFGNKTNVEHNASLLLFILFTALVPVMDIFSFLSKYLLFVMLDLPKIRSILKMSLLIIMQLTGEIYGLDWDALAT